jgi:adenylate cyclase class IV
MMRRVKTGRLLWLSAIGFEKYSHAAFFSSYRPSAFHPKGTIRNMFLEVEQKFQLTESGDLELRLRDLGFLPKGTVTFVDWYFDTADHYLTTRDCWLRFREKEGKGRWELKRGRGQNSSSTVYQESEGEEAVSIALSIVPETTSKSISLEDKEFDGFEAPKIPVDAIHGLVPFCRLETRRSSWKVDPDDTKNDLSGLAVDLDTTNTGHAVGEVETVVSNDSEVLQAKERVQDLITKLTGTTGSGEGSAVGKLEHFLMNQRPEHFEACVNSGVIQKKTKN